MKELLQMLTYKRPNRTIAEDEYIQRYIAPLASPDRFGNYIATVGKSPVTMFSSHTDTVHKKQGRQKVFVDSIKNLAYVDADCLGADDGTGNWIMLEMIREGIPGLYIFHRGEEVGGLGSSYISRQTPELLDGIKHAVAFDRAYKTDVITSQASGKCCSNEFADALAAMLGKEWSDSWGTFTDTANYTHLIPECTNISVGYLNQHTAKETQCLEFAQWLRDRVMSIDWDSLPVERDVTDFDDGTAFSYHGNYGYQGAYGGTYDVYGQSQPYYQQKPKNNTLSPGMAYWRAMNRFVKNNPGTITDYLCDHNLGVSYLRKYEWWDEIDLDDEDGEL